MNKRFLVSIIAGAILGVVCVVGAQIRSSFDYSTAYLFSFWFNRLLMGIVIGLLVVEPNIKKALLRGAIIGIVISFAFYSSTGFNDHIGFLVGAVYGVIIEFVAIKIK